MMVPPPANALIAGFEALIAAALLLTFGYLLADAVAGRTSLDCMFRWALALPCLMTFVLLLMLAHILTGGAVFSHPWVVRGAVFGTAAALLVRKRGASGTEAGSRRPEGWLAFWGLMLLGTAVWGLLVWRTLPLFFGGDVVKHMAWTSQLLNGATTPTALVTGTVPNYYPWLFHALSATVTAFTPGGRALHSLGPLQLLQVWGAVAALFCLGREVTRRWEAGAFTAVFGALTGGFGWAIPGGSHLVIDPRANGGRAAVRYLGDLLFARSYDIGFHNLAPPFPRDITYSLVPVFLLLVVVGLSRPGYGPLVGAGVVMGLLGLTDAEALFVTMLTAVFASLAAGELRRIKAAAAMLVPAISLYALWVAPLFYNYFALGGFAHITRVGPVVLPWWAILGGWGIVTPFAVYGGSRLLPAIRTRPGVKVLFLYLSAAGALVITATIAMGDAGGFTTLLRAHRYWPLLFLGIAICAGAGASYFLDVVREAGRRKVRAAMAIIVCLAIPSPITASIALPTISSGDMYDSLTGDPDTLLNVIASWHAKGMCTVAAPDNLEQAGSIAGYTGYRLVSFPNGTETGNPAIRWADLHAQRPSDTERALVNRQITEGRATPHTWRTLVRAFGVDFVVIPLRRLGASAFHTLDDIRPVPSEDVAVARVGKCSE